MTDTTYDYDEDVELTEYTSESEGPVSSEPARKPTASAPGAGTGRRKQAIARVRIVPGTGEWTINGRTLENYFPNKVHQQIVNEPLAVLELEGYGALATGRQEIVQLYANVRNSLDEIAFENPRISAVAARRGAVAAFVEARYRLAGGGEAQAGAGKAVLQWVKGADGWQIARAALTPDPAAAVEMFLREGGARQWQRELVVPVLAAALS